MKSLRLRRDMKKARYIWMCMDSAEECDIRRYAFSHTQALAIVSKDRKGWSLYKLVKVNKRKATT